MQFSNTSHTLKELLNHSLVYPLCPVLIGREEDRGRKRNRMCARGDGGKNRMSGEMIIVKKARDEKEKRDIESKLGR